MKPKRKPPLVLYFRNSPSDLRAFEKTKEQHRDQQLAAVDKRERRARKRLGLT